MISRFCQLSTDTATSIRVVGYAAAVAAAADGEVECAGYHHRPKRVRFPLSCKHYWRRSALLREARGTQDAKLRGTAAAGRSGCDDKAYRRQEWRIDGDVLYLVHRLTAVYAEASVSIAETRFP